MLWWKEWEIAYQFNSITCKPEMSILKKGFKAFSTNAVGYQKKMRDIIDSSPAAIWSTASYFKSYAKKKKFYGIRLK